MKYMLMCVIDKTFFRKNYFEDADLVNAVAKIPAEF